MCKTNYKHFIIINLQFRSTDPRKEEIRSANILPAILNWLKPLKFYSAIFSFKWFSNCCTRKNICPGNFWKSCSGSQSCTFFVYEQGKGWFFKSYGEHLVFSAEPLFCHMDATGFLVLTCGVIGESTGGTGTHHPTKISLFSCISGQNNRLAPPPHPVRLASLPVSKILTPATECDTWTCHVSRNYLKASVSS